MTDNIALPPLDLLARKPIHKAAEEYDRIVREEQAAGSRRFELGLDGNAIPQPQRTRGRDAPRPRKPSKRRAVPRIAVPPRRSPPCAISPSRRSREALARPAETRRPRCAEFRAVQSRSPIERSRTWNSR